MSYAAAASRGPKQSAEEKRAPAPPSVEHTSTASTASLIDVDTDSVHTVPADFASHAVQTTTQAERLEREVAEADALIAAAAAAREKHARASPGAAKPGAAQGHGAGADNPIVVANAVAVVGLSAAFGFAAYRKYASGEMTWKLAGLWAGVVGLFGAGDYYLSRYLDKKYAAAR